MATGGVKAADRGYSLTAECLSHGTFDGRLRHGDGNVWVRMEGEGKGIA